MSEQRRTQDGKGGYAALPKAETFKGDIQGTKIRQMQQKGGEIKK
jgi:hypothetical protein